MKLNADSLLPVHAGNKPCLTCGVALGETHTLSCPQVTYEVYEAWRSAVSAEFTQQQRTDRRRRIAGRLLAGAAVAAALLLIWGGLL